MHVIVCFNFNFKLAACSILSLEDGFVSYTTLHNANGNFQLGTEVNFTCVTKGTGLDGPPTINCTNSVDNSGWNDAPPTCEG